MRSLNRWAAGGPAPGVVAAACAARASGASPLLSPWCKAAGVPPGHCYPGPKSGPAVLLVHTFVCCFALLFQRGVLPSSWLYPIIQGAHVVWLPTNCAANQGAGSTGLGRFPMCMPPDGRYDPGSKSRPSFRSGCAFKLQGTCLTVSPRICLYICTSICRSARMPQGAHLHSSHPQYRGDVTRRDTMCDKIDRSAL